MKTSIKTLLVAFSLIIGCTVAQAQSDKEGTNHSTPNGTNKNGNSNTTNTGTDNTPTGGYQNGSGGTSGEMNRRDYENTNTQTPNVVGSPETPPNSSVNPQEINNANMDNRQDKYISDNTKNTGKATTTTKTNNAVSKKTAKHASTAKKSTKR